MHVDSTASLGPAHPYSYAESRYARDRARRNAAAETAVASMHLQVDGIRLYAYLVGSGCSVRVVGLIHRPPPLSRVPESRCARSQRRRLVAGKPRADVRTNATLRQLCYVEHASRTPGNEPSAGRNREADLRGPQGPSCRQGPPLPHVGPPFARQLHFANYWRIAGNFASVLCGPRWTRGL